VNVSPAARAVFCASSKRTCLTGRADELRIIGSGVAGIAAVEAIRSVDKVNRVVMIGDDPHGFYSRPGLAYYLTGELHDKALFPRTADNLRKLNFHYVKGRVAKILRDQQVLEFTNGQDPLPYDRLLIAVGAQALPLEVPGASLEGVLKSTTRGCETHLKFARGKAAVVGWRNYGAELVEGLVARRKSIICWGSLLTMFDQREREERGREEMPTDRL
jgi:NAD(P)H-nitrite reductase large subunit